MSIVQQLSDPLKYPIEDPLAYFLYSSNTSRFSYKMVNDPEHDVILVYCYKKDRDGHLNFASRLVLYGEDLELVKDKSLTGTIGILRLDYKFGRNIFEGAIIHDMAIDASALSELLKENDRTDGAVTREIAALLLQDVTLHMGTAERDHITISAYYEDYISDAGNDIFEMESWDFHDLRLDGGEGIDTVDIYFGDGLKIDLTKGTLIKGDAVYQFMLKDIEVIKLNTNALVELKGSDLDERLFATARSWTPVTLYGAAGDDRLEVKSGSAELFGGAGNDTLLASDDVTPRENGELNDTLWGGSGQDTVDYKRMHMAVSVLRLTMNLEEGFVNQIWHGDAIQTDLLKGIENIIGSGYNDKITGSSVANVLNGMGGNDRIAGLSGDDRLIGGTGVDSLYGGSGDDLLKGGTIGSLLFGGQGQDTLISTDGYATMMGGVGDDLIISQRNHDRFLFDVGDGTDTIRGFEETPDHADFLYLNHALVGAATSGAQVLQDFARLEKGIVVLDFGTTEIRLVGVHSLDGLADNIVLF